MNIQIITSSYPAFEGDPSGTAGLFVQSFANELAFQGHTVVVQPVARKDSYQTKPGITVVSIPWKGGDQELASMNFLNPLNWVVFFRFFIEGRKCILNTHKKYDIDRTLCLWVVPCGLFGYWIKKEFKKDYDVWALGSDIWKIREIPIIGKYLIRKVVRNARGVFADGWGLADSVKAITKRDCAFLPSSRKLPRPEENLAALEPAHARHFLFVGRYHENKGPDLLLRAIAEIKQEERTNLKVHFFGAGSLEKSLKKSCLDLGLNDTVVINGPINDQAFANYLSQVSFLIIPSRVESIPVVFSDALQSETPVISTPIGDLPFFIKKHHCGILAQDVSPQALSLAITTAMKMQKKNFAEGVHCAYQTFEIKNSVEQWLKHTALNP